MRNVQVLRRQRSIDSGSSGVASGLVRILVLDDDSEIIGQLENALWVWPHKVALTANVEDAHPPTLHDLIISVQRIPIW